MSEKINKPRNNLNIKLKLPSLKRVSSIIIDNDTVFIVAAGFEDRRFAYMRHVSPSNGSKVLILDYRPFDEKNDLAGMMSCLKKKGVKVSESNIIIYDRFDPHCFPNELKEKIIAMGVKRVLLDISAMSKLAILLCMDVFCELNLDVKIFYAEAKIYGPSEKEFNSAWEDKDFYRPSIRIYTGIHKVLRVSRLSSVAMQGQPTAAIAFMSFNEELTQALLSTVYPSRFLLINGKPPTLSWRENATAWIHEKLRKEWNEHDNPTERKLPKMVTSTRNYRETVQLLLDIYWKLALDYRILLAPTGSVKGGVKMYRHSGVKVYHL